MKKIFALFFFVLFLKQIVWISSLPAFQTPDEQAHFGEVQNIAEGNPILAKSSKELEIAEKRLGVWRDINGNNKYTYNPKYNIKYSPQFYGIYEKEINNIPLSFRKNLTFSESTAYPPLYYIFSSLIYKIFYFSNLFTRIFAIRIFQSVFYLLTLFIFWLFSKEVWKNEKEQLLFLIFAGFLPMFSFVASGITSDNLMNFLFSLGIYLGLLIIKNGYKIKYLLTMLFLFIAGVLTKPHFVILIPILSLAFWMRFYSIKKKTALAIFIALFIFIFFVFIFFSDVFFRYIPFIDYASRNEKASVSFLSYSIISFQKAWRETIPWFWGVYRWLSLGNPFFLRKIFNFLTFFAGFSIGFYLIKMLINRKFFINEKKDLTINIYLVSSVFIYYFILLFWDYLFFLSHNFSFGMQGRYYFPVLLPIVYAIFYFPKKNLGEFWGSKYFLSLAVFSVLANFIVLFHLLKSYYDMSSFQMFIIQISQYKPVFLKNLFFPILFSTYIVSLFLLFPKLLKK